MAARRKHDPHLPGASMAPPISTTATCRNHAKQHPQHVAHRSTHCFPAPAPDTHPSTSPSAAVHPNRLFLLANNTPPSPSPLREKMCGWDTGDRVTMRLAATGLRPSSLASLPTRRHGPIRATMALPHAHRVRHLLLPVKPPATANRSQFNAAHLLAAELLAFRAVATTSTLVCRICPLPCTTSASAFYLGDTIKMQPKSKQLNMKIWR